MFISSVLIRENYILHTDCADHFQTNLSGSSTGNNEATSSSSTQTVAYKRKAHKTVKNYSSSEQD